VSELEIKKGDEIIVNDNENPPFEAIVLAILENETIVGVRKDNLFSPFQVGLAWVKKKD
jgi:hypothetical protein